MPNRIQTKGTITLSIKDAIYIITLVVGVTITVFTYKNTVADHEERLTKIELRDEQYNIELLSWKIEALKSIIIDFATALGIDLNYDAYVTQEMMKSTNKKQNLRGKERDQSAENIKNKLDKLKPVKD